MRNRGIVEQQLGQRSPAGLLAGLLALLVAGCPGGGGTPTIEFDSPRDGAMFTPDDDVDADLDGVQIEVVVTTENLGDVGIGLLLNGDLVGEAEAEASLSFEPTLVPGSNTLQLALKTSDGEWDTDGPQIEVFLTDSCGRVSFVSPMAPEDGSSLSLGGDNFCQTDGRMIEVVVATPDVADNTDVQLVIGGNVYATEQVDGGTVTFSGVELSTGSNDMYVSITAEDGGAACDDVAFPVTIDVDCEAPQCRITAPMTGGDTLTGEDDISPTVPGLQVDVQVTTDEMANGQPVKLTIDGNEDAALMGEAGPDGSDIKATFRAVTLAEGRRMVRAQCADALGNTANAQAELDVDTQACGIEITAVSPSPTQPGNVLFTPATPLDVTVTVDVDGDDCAELRSSVAGTDACANVGMGTATTLSPGPSTTSQDLELVADGTNFLCAQVVDDAGNAAVAFVEVSLVTTAPKVAINLPSGATSPVAYSTASGDGIPDLDDLTPECDVELTVSCLDYTDAPLDGETVTLHHGDTDAELGSAPCVNGEATVSAALPSDNSGVGYNVVAKVTAGGIEGVSMGFPVQPDCEAPTVEWPVDPVCGGIYRPGDDIPPDANPGTSEYEVDGITVVVAEQLDSELYVQASGDSPAATPAATVTDPASENVVFDGVVVEGFGAIVSLVACATDPAGNRTCTDDSCVVTVADVPFVDIHTPADGATLFADLSGSGVGYRDTTGDGVGDPPAGFDCGLGQGSLAVTASTNALPTIPDNPDNIVRISLGGAALTVGQVLSGGGSTYPNSIDSGCLAVDADSPSVVLSVTVENASDALESTSQVTLAVDTSAPDQVQNLVVSNADPVDGLACRTVPVIGWDAIATDASFEGYEVRCDHTQITDEATWQAAEFQYEPGLGALTQELTGYRPGQDMYCYVRAYDQAGAYSPLSAELLVEPPGFEIVDLDWPEFLLADDSDFAAPTAGVFVAGVGDVDDDGFDDFFVSGGVLGSSHGYLYFGQQSFGPASAAPRTVQFRFTNAAAFPGYFARSVAGLGDINGDEIDDFAFRSGHRSFAPQVAQVHVVLGRTTGWPASDVVVDVNAGGCGTDVCLSVGGMTSLGEGLTGVGDFDSDGTNDFAIGAEFINGYSGESNRFPAPMVIKGRAFTPIALGTESGECLDLGGHVPAPDGIYDAPTCAGVGSSSEPDGFILDAVSGLGGNLASTGQGEILVADTSSAGVIQLVRGVAYPDTEPPTTGLVSYAGNGGTASTVASLPTGSSRAISKLRVIGDYDGDGSLDYGVSARSRDRMFIYYGSGSGSSYTVTNAERQYIIEEDILAGPFVADFGMAFRGLEVPGKDYYADLNGDAKADFLVNTSHHESAVGAPEGVVDVGWGGAFERGGVASTSRTAMRANGWFQPIGPVPDPRYSALVGQLDGDDYSDFVIVEFDPAAQDTGRLMLVGVCEAN